MHHVALRHDHSRSHAHVDHPLLVEDVAQIGLARRLVELEGIGLRSARRESQAGVGEVASSCRLDDVGMDVVHVQARRPVARVLAPGAARVLLLAPMVHVLELRARGGVGREHQEVPDAAGTLHRDVRAVESHERMLGRARLVDRLVLRPTLVEGHGQSEIANLDRCVGRVFDGDRPDQGATRQLVRLIHREIAEGASTGRGGIADGDLRRTCFRDGSAALHQAGVGAVPRRTRPFTVLEHQLSHPLVVGCVLIGTVYRAHHVAGGECVSHDLERRNLSEITDLHREVRIGDGLDGECPRGEERHHSEERHAGAYEVCRHDVPFGIILGYLRSHPRGIESTVVQMTSPARRHHRSLQRSPPMRARRLDFIDDRWFAMGGPHRSTEIPLTSERNAPRKRRIHASD